MILEHCNRAACTQIIEALRAQVADFDAILDAKQSEVCELESQVAAMTKEFHAACDDIIATEKKLTAAQATIERLREAADDAFGFVVERAGSFVEDQDARLADEACDRIRRMADELEAGK